LAKEGAKFDLIFLDPPYRLLEERNPLKVIRKREILMEDGTIVLRHHFKTQFEGKFFDVQRRIEIGDDVIVFYKHSGRDKAKNK
jgi:16S rRNA G966 N2-methylase RsmD